MPRWLLLALAALCLYGALDWWKHRPLAPPAGLLAATLPQQVELPAGTTLRRGDFQLAVRASFELTARVLAREDYRLDAGAALAPTDLALGWGRMSDSAVLARIRIDQGSRFYHWWTADFPIPRREIETSSANMHLIPADAAVQEQLERVRVGQRVHLSGFLVDATRADGWHWASSLSREDTGAGACELFYVEALQIEPFG